jgi:hypothetical protein
MVPNSGTKARARAIKPLNAPTAVAVSANERGMPESLSYGKKVYEVASIEDMWKINDEWWRGQEMEIERVYFNARLTDGRPVTLFHNLAVDEWFRQ